MVFSNSKKLILFLFLSELALTMMMNNNAFAVLSNEEEENRVRISRPHASRPMPISKETLNKQPRLAYGSLITSLASKSVWKDNVKREIKEEKKEEEYETDNSDYYDHEYDEGPPLVWCIERDYEY
jgi:hypothetical protein